MNRYKENLPENSQNNPQEIFKKLDISREVFENFKESEQKNPLNNIEKCKLLNNKKKDLYTHTYDPQEILKILKEKLNISDEVLDRFVKEKKEKCCNVIAISLYFTNCGSSTLEKYLNSIYRSVINVQRNLKDWVVRVYFDKSVYNCIIEETTTREIQETFRQIIESSNVEVYTYICPSFENKMIPIARTRTLRFIPMIDEEVNICVVREADGIVSNLDCHNIKIFSNSDKIFYLPVVVKDYNNLTLEDDILFSSYSLCLQLYKVIFEQDFFISHQNLYDLLAGTFGVKLKIKRDYYELKIIELQRKIKNFLSASVDDKKQNIKDVKFFDKGAKIGWIKNLHNYIENENIEKIQINIKYRI